jgi:Pyruvate/2-oxoacid:ferredoxin oxidoreductase gamma subunit
MTFDPTAIATPAAGHNLPPHLQLFEQINDLYAEAKNWADGEPIASVEMHDAITKLYDGLHELGKQADELRKEQKKPLDDAVQAVQTLYNPYIQPKRGKVDLGKAALGELLAAWRARVAAEKAAEAARIAEAADAARVAANAAMQASSGNLAAREEAEEQLADAKRLEKTANRSWKAATTGTGLRTVWDVTLVDEEAALDWAYGRAADEFRALAQKNAEEQVRAGVRSVPGFSVVERKVAA